MYLDSSYIVKIYTTENGSALVHDLIEGCDNLSSSIIAEVEFYSTMARKRAESYLTEDQYQRAISLFELHKEQYFWHFRSVDREIIERCNLILSSMQGRKLIRSLDTIHLSTASILGFREVYSDDNRMLDMAATWGLKGINILA